jgi:hypothetical protein
MVEAAIFADDDDDVLNRRSCLDLDRLDRIAGSVAIHLLPHLEELMDCVTGECVIRHGRPGHLERSGQ